MTQEKQFERRINLFIEQELLDRIDSAAKKRGWKRSLLIREAAREYLKKEVK